MSSWLPILLQEMESEQKLKRVQELAEAELAAAIVNEKAAQIEKMAEANLHVSKILWIYGDYIY